MQTTATTAPGLERRLRSEISGDIWFDRFTRGRYATDASHYQMLPLGVVAPRTMAEAERAIALGAPGGHDGVTARRWHLAERPDGQSFAGDRLLQVSQPHR